MNILVSYRGIPHARGRETGASVARAFRQLGHSVYEYGNYYRSPERLGSDKPPSTIDLLAYCECNDSDPQYTELKNLDAGCKVYWDFDVHTHPAATLLFILRMGFDFVFFANKLYESSFRKLCARSYFLPYAIDDQVHRRIPDVERTVDVGLCGSPYPSRLALIQALKDASIDARLFHGVYGEDMIRLINSFKIHLNYNPQWGRGILNGRVWETTGCGTLLLTQQEDFIDLFFKDEEHLVLYRDMEDCLRKARELLGDDARREQIAQRGYEHAHRNHTYVSRAQTILQTISQPDVGDRIRPNRLAAVLEIVRSYGRGGIKN